MGVDWFENAVFYQIYPLGFVGAPHSNDSAAASSDAISADAERAESGEDAAGAPDPNSANAVAAPSAPVLKVIDWIPHLKALGITAVYFSPVFESDSHGYDTRDYRRIDKRLGTNDDFRAVVDALHDAGIRVVIDGVFNHVGRGFWAFQDVLANRERSPYLGWFHINLDGDDAYGDGLWYEGWEGCYDLVKLNLQNPEVVGHLLDNVGFWMDEFDIDGLRLDVAYMLDENFMRQLRTFVKSRDDQFLLLGEMIHGDYNRIMNDQMLDSVTNYECYKGLYSAFNSMNMFEIGHSLARQFGPEPWTLYEGRHLLDFADNHDVTRVASVLQDKAQLPALYTVLFCMPGVPCIYYGSEWGAEGRKEDGDWGLRPSFDAPAQNELTQHIGRLARAKAQSKALTHGDFRNTDLRNKQWVFTRSCDGETVFVAVNAEGCDVTMACDHHGTAHDLLTGEDVQIDGAIQLAPYESKVLCCS